MAPDPTRVRCAATAVRDAATGDYVLNGEKWFVTGPDDTDFMIFHCLLVDGDERLPTLFLVDYDTPGVAMKHDPDYTHTFADRHPQFVLTDVRVPARRVLGGIGRADELTNEWFVEERIHIGARCSGAMERLLSLALEWATERVQFGERIYDFQGVSFPLADSAADASAARLLTRECAWLADTGADPKVVHAKASLAKLFASEAAWRCADRVVQVFGGRGYMREYAPERFLRELRVDRIWEGTSEIQQRVHCIEVLTRFALPIRPLVNAASLFVSSIAMPARSASARTASGNVYPSCFIKKSIALPDSLQPKQWKKPQSPLTWKLAVFSLWKGQRPTHERPRRFNEGTDSLMTARMWVRATRAMVSGEIIRQAMQHTKRSG